MSLIPTTHLYGHLKAFSVGAPTSSSAPLAITAAGTGDATAVTGETIDTLAQRGDSMVLVIAAHCDLTADKVLTIAAELQESSDDSTWDTAEALYAATTVVSGTGEQFGVKMSHVDLTTRKRYIRFNYTPNLTATSSDTAVIVGVALMAGGKVLPVS